jgi:transposase
VGLEESLDRKLGLAVEWGCISTVEVVMRPPSVFVRALQHEEAVRLKRLSRRAKHESTRQRASVLLASNVRMAVPQIAEMRRTDPSWVRKVIHEFNERGMDSLRPRYRGGRPRRITTDQRQRIVSVAGARPDAQGIPLTRWSLRLRLRARPPRQLPKQRPPRPANRRRRSQTPDRRLMPLRVEPNFKGH